MSLQTGLAWVKDHEIPAVISNNAVLFAVATVCIFGLLCWRLIKFTVFPALYPNDPKEYPYWIPVIGHALGFYSNSDQVLADARQYFNNVREPFALTVAGSTIYVLTKPNDVSAAYRNTTTLSFNEFVKALMRMMGNTESCVQAMYTPLPSEKKGFPNRHGKPLGTLAREMHIKQLHPGEQLNQLVEVFVDSFAKNLQYNTLLDVPFADSANDKEVVVPLMKWTSDIFTRAGTRAYFGESLTKIAPDLTWAFIEFDELSWQVLYQAPKILTRRMNAAKAQIEAALKEYFAIPQEQRTGDAWFTKTMEDEMRALDIDDDDIAAMFVTIYWGINTNTRKAAFWMLAFILYNPGLVDVIRKETEAAFTKDKLDTEHLDNCPTLSSIWNETIRMTAYSASVRLVAEDTVIGGKTLRAGNRLMVPYRQLHFDDSIFGEDAKDFNADRFLNNGKLTQSASWRPFGGGVTMCPGRYVAKQSVVTFVAMLLHEYDIELAGLQKFPQPELGKPVLGLMSTKGGSDLHAKLTPRKQAV